MTRRRSPAKQATSREAPWEALHKEIERLRSDLRRRDAALRKTIDQLGAAVRDGRGGGVDSGGSAADSMQSDEHKGYEELKRTFRSFLRRQLPRGATVAVAARGDDHLLSGKSVKAVHFPQAADGGFAGHYPPDGTPAIAHLESLRAAGVGYLAFPQTSLWWLEAYPRLSRHLADCYELVSRLDDVGVVYRLERPSGPRSADGWDGLARLVESARADSARALSIMDWDSGLELGDRFPGDSVFAARAGDDTLPYLDDSIDIVAVASSDVDRLDEARRVARLAVVHGTDHGATNGIEIEQVADLTRANQEASIIIPTYNGIAHLDSCLRALQETLPHEFAGEVIVVDDSSARTTATALGRWTRKVPWLRVLRNSRNLGFISSCNRGARAARTPTLVFLNDDTIPQRGWLTALLRTFEQHPDAGVVGGRLVYPDGRLQEAGNIIFRDGTGANFGRNDYEADAPLYAYVRRVDYCSGALLATPAELFRELGGFDRRYRPAYYEDTDYCFAVRETGRHVYYQPDSVVIHLEGATSGTDIERGAKSHQAVNRKRFERKWRHRLVDQPAPPDRYDRWTWLQLAAGREVA